MAFATFTAAKSGNNNVSTHNWTLPTGNASGKLLVLICSLGTGNDQFNTPSGFTQLSGSVLQTIGGNGGATLQVFYKFTTGSESNGTITTSGNCSSEILSLLFTGAHASFAPAYALATNTDTHPNAPSLNPANWDVEDTVWVTFHYTSTGSETPGTWSDPTNYTNIDSGSVGTGTAAIEFRAAYRNNAVASEDPAQITIGASNLWGALTLAIAPAGAGSVTPSAGYFVGYTVDPTVVLGSLTLTPSPATHVDYSVNPTVILGSVIVTPNASYLVTYTVNPTVSFGGLNITPSAVYLITASVDPSLIFGSISITPSIAWAKFATQNPNVIGAFEHFPLMLLLLDYA